MTHRWLHNLICAAGLAAGPLSAQDSGTDWSEWNNLRAGLYSDVCMKSAPDFTAFQANALAAGFQSDDAGLFYPPEVRVSLLPSPGPLCTCMMTLGAPDQTALAAKIFDRLLTDFGRDFVGAPRGSVNFAPFRLDGVEVLSVLQPGEVDGATWLAAQVTVQGECPVPEVLQ